MTTALAESSPERQSAVERSTNGSMRSPSFRLKGNSPPLGVGALRAVPAHLLVVNVQPPRPGTDDRALFPPARRREPCRQAARKRSRHPHHDPGPNRRGHPLGRGGRGLAVMKWNWDARLLLLQIAWLIRSAMNDTRGDENKSGSKI